jgi:hypothetical protein
MGLPRAYAAVAHSGNMSGVLQQLCEWLEEKMLDVKYSARTRRD